MNDNENHLTASISVNENLSKYCGWAVVAGLIVDVYLAWEYQGHSTWIENWGPVFANVLIALGVFGEIHFAGRVSKSEEELRRKSDEKVAEANARAAEAQRETAQLRAHNALIADALVATAQAGRDNALAAAAIRTTTEQLALVQGLVAPEKMSEAARSLLIIPKITPFAGKQFDAVVTSKDIELRTLLGSLKAALKTAGWIEVETNSSTIHREQQSSAGGSALVMIQVDPSKISELWEAAVALTSALNADGIEAIANQTPAPENSTANAIHILIGPKTQ